MNKIQEQSSQAKDARFLTGIIDDGFAENNANHEKTQEMLSELLNRSNQPIIKTPALTLGGVAFNRDYYNLFVIGGEDFKNGSFTVPKAKALVTSIESDVKKQFFDLRNENVVERILSLPSLFMSENVDYMRSRPGQKAFFGRVTDLTIEPNDIRISFEVDIQIFQQSITDISQSLGIIGNPGCSELNNTHWIIKRVDLITILTEAKLLALPTQEKQEPVHSKYRFLFTINMDSKTEPFTSATTNAIKEWFEEKANDVISEMRNESLRDTFEVEIDDMRICKHEELDALIHKKLADNIQLNEQEEYLKWGVKRVLKRDNAFSKAALEMIFSNRIIKGIMGITHHSQLFDIAKSIIEFRYGNLTNEIPSNQDLISLDVYLNSNRRNEKHESFVAYVKKESIKELFGGTGIYDLYDRRALELTNCREDIILHYAFFLAELSLSGYDFSKDDRMLNLMNFWVGLH